MNRKKMMYALLMVVLIQGVLADGLSVQLKRTNPGIVNTRSAELIFDIVNTDINHELEGFLLCKSPDDVTVGSTLGVGSGSGAQYISPKFEINKGPSQKSISLTIDSAIEGDMRTGCILKYIPFIPEIENVETYDEGTNSTILTERIIRVYSMMNGETIEKPMDRDYRELRLDKSVPFVKVNRISDAACPEGQSNCSVDDVVVKFNKNWFIYGFFGLFVMLLAFVFFTSGRKGGL